MTKNEALVTAVVDDLVPSADELESNVKRYQQMQTTLDRLMPDQIVETGSNADGSPKLFRRKGYWKAIAQGFSLTVELVTEQRESFGEDDFGYCVTAKATDPRTGRSADGDGACFASEKAQRRGGIGGTEHNVRAHAHTRATNRAISNLVAFGEVSAEELETTGGAKRQWKAKPVAAAAPVASKATLDDHDGAERITDVTAARQLSNGTTVWKITSTRRRYTCLDDDVAACAETAVSRGCTVELEWEEKATKPRNGQPGKPFNALKAVTLVEDTVALEMPTADDIPF
jgi:hypothetical protein